LREKKVFVKGVVGVRDDGVCGLEIDEAIIENCILLISTDFLNLNDT
jgi:hypothetical protein